MQSAIKKEEGLKRLIEIVIPEEEVSKAYEKIWSQIQKQAKIQGFRQGKVPMEKIKKGYALEAHKKVTDELFQKFYLLALKEQDLKPVSSPILKDLKLEEGSEALFSLEVELHPTVKVKNYKKLEIKKEEAKATDKDVEEALKRLQKASASKEGDKEVLPQVDDEFAKKFKMKSADELKKRIREDIEKSKEAQMKEKMENDIIDELVKKNPIELPEALIQDQKKRLKDNAKRRLEEYKVPSAEQEKFLREKEDEFDKEARRSLHASYLVEKLVDELKMKATEEDIKKSLTENFPMRNPEDMEKELKQGNYWNGFLFNLARQKTISYLIDEAKLI